MDAKDLLSERVSKNTRFLFKNFLVLMEDLQNDHQIAFDKLKEAMPERLDLINQADYFDDHKMQYLRKKVLDMGNESLRESSTHLEKFTINFNFKN